MNVILLGPPGSGKGTQAELLCEKYGLTHISPGKIAREGTDKTAQEFKKYMDKGELAPAELTMRLISKYLSENNLFDGFPRKLDQAEKLDESTDISLVIEIKISDKEAIKRLSNRVECMKCKASYPQEREKCECGGELAKRRDDFPDIIKKRLERYHEETEPLLEYYKSREIVHIIDGNKNVDEVFKQICNIIDSVVQIQ